MAIAQSRHIFPINEEDLDFGSCAGGRALVTGGEGPAIGPPWLWGGEEGTPKAFCPGPRRAQMSVALERDPDPMTTFSQLSVCARACVRVRVYVNM